MEYYAIIRHKFLIEGLSQRQIASQLGISRNTVAKYCKGDTLRRPSGQLLSRCQCNDAGRYPVYRTMF